MRIHLKHPTGVSVLPCLSLFLTVMQASVVLRVAMCWPVLALQDSGRAVHMGEKVVHVLAEGACSIFDMVRAQYTLLDHLGIEKLYASVRLSMGGMQSLAAGWMSPKRVGKIVSISGTAHSSPSSIAVRFAQRSGMWRIQFLDLSLLTMS